MGNQAQHSAAISQVVNGVEHSVEGLAVESAKAFIEEEELEWAFAACPLVQGDSTVEGATAWTCSYDDGLPDHGGPGP
jgi:hypothetical protein